MNDIALGLQLLNDTIAFEKKHPDYKRVTALAKEYHDIFTGSGVKDYLRTYRKAESEDSFQQMLDIYETTVPSVVHNLDTIFEKPLRSNRIFSTIDHTNNGARDEILDRMKSFWQGETESGLDAYLQERWKHLVMYDPNAFIVIEFETFNPIKEKTRPFAIEYTSKEAINYQYINGVMDWLICEKEHWYESRNGGTNDAVNAMLNNKSGVVFVQGSKFILYLENSAVVYTEIDKVHRIIPNDILSRKNFNQQTDIVEIRKDPNQAAPDRVFVKQVFDMKSGKVPAFRVGYLQDPESASLPRTTLSNIHYALAFFKKELKSGSELDLTIRAHVFPKTFMYGPRCPGDPDEGKPCNAGKTTNGETCRVCNGTGVLPVHTTSTDIIIVPWPKNNEDAINLKEVMAQFSPDMDLVRFMVDFCEHLTEKAKSAVFPSQSVSTSKNTFAKNNANPSQPTTATEQDYSWDNVYDAYRPFTSKYSYAWLFITSMIAIYTDNLNGFKNYHAFPRDYKLKPISVLTTEAASAKDAGLPQHVMQAIYNDIADIVYADDQDTLTKIQIKNKFHPFSGKSKEEIQAVLYTEEILPYFKILYIYFDIIFDQIDQELGDKFYLLKYEAQKAEVDRRVNAIMTQVEQAKAKSFKEAQKFQFSEQ